MGNIGRYLKISQPVNDKASLITIHSGRHYKTETNGRSNYFKLGRLSFMRNLTDLCKSLMLYINIYVQINNDTKLSLLNNKKVGFVIIVYRFLLEKKVTDYITKYRRFYDGCCDLCKFVVFGCIMGLRNQSLSRLFM